MENASKEGEKESTYQRILSQLSKRRRTFVRWLLSGSPLWLCVGMIIFSTLVTNSFFGPGAASFRYSGNANLERAVLGNANLEQAKLHRVNLRKAELGSANLTEADLHGADLTDADLVGTVFDRANLRNAVGLTHALEDCQVRVLGNVGL